MSATVMLVICLLFGLFGIHKFLEGKILAGLIYMFTYGLFGIGWLIDICRYVRKIAQEKKTPLKEKSQIEVGVEKIKETLGLTEKYVICPYCGSKNNKGDFKCSNCNAPL